MLGGLSKVLVERVIMILTFPPPPLNVTVFRVNLTLKVFEFETVCVWVRVYKLLSYSTTRMYNHNQNLLTMQL